MVAHSRNREVHHAGRCQPFFAERTVTGMVAAEDWVPDCGELCREHGLEHLDGVAGEKSRQPPE